MRITLTLNEVQAVAELAKLTLPDGVESIAYTVEKNLTVEINSAGVTVIRGSVNSQNSIYTPGTK